MLDFTDLPAMINFVGEKVAGVDDEEIEALLVASAATTCAPPQVPAFRPYWVIATLLGENPARIVRARSAAGSEVEYASPSDAVRAYRRRQEALDSTLCNVPPGFASGSTFEVTW